MGRCPRCKFYNEDFRKVDYHLLVKHWDDLMEINKNGGARGYAVVSEEILIEWKNRLREELGM